MSRPGLVTAGLIAVAVVIAAIAIVPQRLPPPPGPGIALSMAKARVARVSQLRYEAVFKIPAARRDAVTGTVTASFALADTDAPLPFDFNQPVAKLHRVEANGRTLEPRVDNGHVVIPRSALARGANTIRFDFEAGNEALNRNDDYLYTLFVPARASLAMPCFDQPDMKARWKLMLDVPSAWAAVANGAEASRVSAGNHTAVYFEETQPISTYLVAFAAGNFRIETEDRNGRHFRMFHRETDAAKVARNRDAIFDLHAAAIRWLEAYTEIPYLFGKFDFVLLPSFQFGGMEHPGAIYYNASSLLLDETATENQRLNRANLISHETSHMWFGNLVTMRWFNDVWLKEVFADFMAAKIVSPSFPAVNHELRFLLQNYPAAYDVDRTDGANPIRQDLANLDDAGSLYGAIIYHKAPIVMRQLELLVGADAFRDGVRRYLRQFSFGNATWADLLAAIQPAATSRDLGVWSHAWVDEPGRPTIRTELETKAGQITRLALRQEDRRGRNLLWPQQIQVVVGDPKPGAPPKMFTITLEAADTDVPGAAGLPAPPWVLPSGGGLGYGLFIPDPATIEFLSASLPSITDPLTRGAALVTASEAMYEGALGPSHIIDALLKTLPSETVELNLQEELGILRTAYWRFQRDDLRAAIAPRLEQTLRDGLARGGTTSQKAAWFSALRAIARSQPQIDWLEAVWRHDETIDGLPLAEQDEYDLAVSIALAHSPHTAEILAAELDRLQNPDRKARFAFVMPALSPDLAERDRLFDSFKDEKNRQRESWVLEAEGYLNHPRHNDAKYIRPALDLLLEIKRTGDIFFPKRWADATLGGYQTPEAAATVRAFLDQLPPDYPPRLKWVVESAADGLFRAARLPP